MKPLFESSNSISQEPSEHLFVIVAIELNEEYVGKLIGDFSEQK